MMRLPRYRQRLFVEHDLGESSGATVDVARRAGYPWPEQMARKMLRNVEKRGVQAAINARKESVSVLALFYPHDLPRFAFTGHWPLLSRHWPRPPRRLPIRRKLASFSRYIRP